MLVLSRKPGETVVLVNITVTVLGVHGSSIRLGLQAPRTSTSSAASSLPGKWSGRHPPGRSLRGRSPGKGPFLETDQLALRIDRQARADHNHSRQQYRCYDLTAGSPDLATAARVRCAIPVQCPAFQPA